MNGTLEAFYDKTAWLYTVVWQTPFFFFDYWSGVHFCSGFALMAMSRWLRLPRPWLCIVAALLTYEFIELAFLWFAVHVFRPESLPDQLTDLWVGCLGAFVADRTCRWIAVFRPVTRPRIGSHHRQDMAIGFVLAFSWVCLYGYRYNIAWLNSSWVNWWALLLW